MCTISCGSCIPCTCQLLILLAQHLFIPSSGKVRTLIFPWGNYPFPHSLCGLVELPYSAVPLWPDDPGLVNQSIPSLPPQLVAGYGGGGGGGGAC